MSSPTISKWKINGQGLIKHQLYIWYKIYHYITTR